MLAHLRKLIHRRPAEPARGEGARRDPLGPKAERLVAKRLRREGYRVIARNAETPAGEADLVCLAPDRRTIVIVEVKARRHEEGEPSAWAPEDAITRAKREKLIRIMGYLARSNRWQDRPQRIDVASVEWPSDGSASVRFYEDAVRPGA